MQYKVANVQDKNADWKVITVEMSEGSFQEDVSVNRKSKKEGEGDFPNFDQIVPGYTVSGELWQSGTGKWYLFAPRAPKAATGGQGGNMKGAAALQNKKFAQIDKSQDRKEFGIQVSSTMANTTLITNELLKGQDFSLEEYSATFERVRKWFIQQWSTTEQLIDVPFPDKAAPKI